MKILIAGSHGMIGSAVMPYLRACGHHVTRLVRSTPGPDEIWWDPDAGKIDACGLEGFDGVVNLATMRWPFRWTAKAKKKLLANRIATYRLLADSLAACVASDHHDRHQRHYAIESGARSHQYPGSIPVSKGVRGHAAQRGQRRNAHHRR